MLLSGFDSIRLNRPEFQHNDYKIRCKLQNTTSSWQLDNQKFTSAIRASADDWAVQFIRLSDRPYLWDHILGVENEGVCVPDELEFSRNFRIQVLLN